ncbi:helix-turn-helix domain-containing protein [Alkalibacillus haloalkaliphilus]|uniref:helix-turn-helix domain-containing protein n=1 Tax=Alkalibacillus haloalkaliphilus TaxID=94136 RepID=UPI002935E370|nr:helix-turn-helix transcriptional regulator [Alkalibacillus haloalkaliphilus]MDV2581581.1 helix-turn-helix transcriptional regulator [Alkalibacillus haloalkaliphilus]
MTIEKVFGEVLKKKRIESELSQEGLAYISDLDRSFISMLERGKRKPTITTIFRLSSCLNIKPSELIKEVEAKVDSYK